MAKPLTLLLRSLANSCGYDLLRIQKVKFEEQEVRTGEQKLEAFDAIVSREIKTFDIYFRSCSQVQIFGSEALRMNTTPKHDVLLTCLNSLIKSIKYAQDKGLDCDFSITMMDDHSDEECVTKMKKLLSTATCKTEFVGLDVTGNGPSLGVVYSHSKKHGRDLIYHVEDDYLHHENAIYEMVMSYGRLAAVAKKDIILFPTDAPALYRTITPTQVMLGHDRHWRRIYGTTGTFVTTKKFLDKHWDKYHALKGYCIEPDISENTTINLIYKEELCLSPMPALTVHYSEPEWLPPFTDWQDLWQKMKPTFAA